MRTCSSRDWLAALLRGRVEVAIFGRSRVGRGWELQDRVVPEHYLTAYLDGAAELVAAGRRAVALPGTIAWIAPQVPHTIRPLDPQRRIRFLHLRFRVFAARGEELRMPADLLLLPQARPLLPQFDALFDEFSARLPHRDARFHALLVALLADLMRLADAGESPPLTSAQRQRLLALAADRHPRPLHPNELAAALGLSHDYFTRQFRRTFGVPPRTWLLRERLRAAAAVLSSSSEPIATIAERCGFGSPYIFSRQFRRVMGVTPTGWRRKRGQEP
jgi:AraC-like DNA-binding protein